MKAKDILIMRIDSDKDKVVLSKFVAKLPFFKKYNYDEIGVDEIERAFHKICKRYPITLSYIMSSNHNEFYYSFMLKNSQTGEWLETIYAVTMFEGFAKILIYAFCYSRKLKAKKEQE